MQNNLHGQTPMTEHERQLHAWCEWLQCISHSQAHLA